MKLVVNDEISISDTYIFRIFIGIFLTTAVDNKNQIVYNIYCFLQLLHIAYHNIERKP